MKGIPGRHSPGFQTQGAGKTICTSDELPDDAAGAPLQSEVSTAHPRDFNLLLLDIT